METLQVRYQDGGISRQRQLEPSTYQNIGREARRPPISSKVWAISSKQSRCPFAYPHATIHIPCFCDFWVNLNHAEKTKVPCSWTSWCSNERRNILFHTRLIGWVPSLTPPLWVMGLWTTTTVWPTNPTEKKTEAAPKNKTIKILGVNNQKTPTKLCHDIQPKQIQNPTQYPAADKKLLPARFPWSSCGDDAWDWCWCSYVDWLAIWLIYYICVYKYTYMYIYT